MTDPYAFGTRSDASRALQQALAARGLYAGAIDGIFGRQTAIAVNAVRQQLGLPEAGTVNPLVLAALGLGPAPENPLRDFLTALLKGWIRMNFLSGYKTYIVAGLMLLTGITGLLGVDIPSFTGQAPGELVMEALAFVFLRQGLKVDAKG